MLRDMSLKCFLRPLVAMAMRVQRLLLTAVPCEDAGDLLVSRDQSLDLQLLEHTRPFGAPRLVTFFVASGGSDAKRSATQVIGRLVSGQELKPLSSTDIK